MASARALEVSKPCTRSRVEAQSNEGRAEVEKFLEAPSFLMLIDDSQNDSTFAVSIHSILCAPFCFRSLCRRTQKILNFPFTEIDFLVLSKLPKLETVFETHASMKVQERRNKFFLLLMPKDKRKGMRAENGLE